MVERRELILICRQIGNMMEAGVDILRITQVLRAQTENEQLLRVYNQFDHDLRMGASIAEAMTRASDVFSPFMVSLVRQAEQRSDLESVSAHVAAAFIKIGEFLQQDEDNKESSAGPSVVEAVISSPLDISAVADSANTWPLTLRAIENFTDRLQLIALRALTLLAGLLLSLAAVWYSVEVKWIEKQWQNVVICSVSALFIAGAGVWVRRQIEKEKQQSQRCSFCGRPDSEDAPLRSVPGFPGAAICANCASSMGKTESEAATAKIAVPQPSTPAANVPKASAKTKKSARTLTLQSGESSDHSGVNGSENGSAKRKSTEDNSAASRPPSRPQRPGGRSSNPPTHDEADYE